MNTTERKTALSAHLDAIEDSASLALQDGTMDPTNVLYHTKKIRELQEIPEDEEQNER